MTPRRRAILIVALVLLLIGILIAAILLLTRAVPTEAPLPAAEETPTDVTEPTAFSDTTFENPLLLPPPPAEEQETASQQMAELFAERYGSYSNQGDYQNLRDLLPVMTARYRRETEAFLATADPTPGATYEGVTSKKVSTDIRSDDGSSAVIAVSLQQEKTVAGSPPTVGYRTLRMSLLKVGTEWKVDSAVWEN